MKDKIIVFAMALSLLFSGMLIAVGGEAEEGKVVEKEVQEIRDWYDLDAVREDLFGDYILMNDLDENTEGYGELASEQANELVDRGEWEENTIYEANDLVEHEGLNYYSIEEHESSEDFEEDYWIETDKEGGDALGWDPIGAYDYGGLTNFEGSFDGRGNVIKDLYIHRPEESQVGLFSSVTYGGFICDVGLIDVNIVGGSDVGSLSGRIDSRNTFTGGLIRNSFSSGEVVGDQYVGGLVGYNMGNSDGTSPTDGVYDSYSLAHVEGEEYVGGLMGRHGHTWWGTGELARSYFGGTLSAEESVGSLIGRANHGETVPSVSDSYWDEGKTGISSGIGLNEPDIFEGEGLGSYEMVGSEAEENMDLDFDDVWETVEEEHEDAEEDGYPILQELSREVQLKAQGIYAGPPEEYIIEDWYDLDAVREDLFGDYILMNHLDENTEGYGELASEQANELVDRGEWEENTIYEANDLVEHEGLNYYSIEEHKSSEDFEEDYWIETDKEGGDALGWKPLGDRDSRFRGTFDGNGHEIKSVYVDRSAEGYIGLFGYVGGGGVIEDVGVIDVDMVGGSTGGLSGRNEGFVNNSYATGYVNGSRTGGLVGENRYGEISNSYADVYVVGEVRVGGLLGHNYQGQVSTSYATGEVCGIDEVGGFVGSRNWLGTISDCYSTGSVTRISGTSTQFGGFMGRNQGGHVQNSYSTGSVHYEDSSDPTNRGFIGNQYYDGTASDNFWDTDLSDQDSTDNGAATGKSTEEMKDVATFTNLSTDGLEGPWDFVGDPYDDEGDEDIWDIDEGINDGYPFLTWQEEFDLTVNIEGNGAVEVDGEEIVDSTTFVYDNGTEVELKAVPDPDWNFVEWTGDHSGTEEELMLTMDQNKVITAWFENDTYELTVNIEGEGTTDPSEGTHTYEEGTEVTVRATADEGWYFDGWSEDAEGTEEEITVVMDQDKDITAHFAIHEYTLTVDEVGEGSVEVDPEQEQYEHGTEVVLTVIPEEDWYFVGWTGDAEGTEEEITVVMDDYKEITAHFEEYVTLRIETEGEGTVDVDPDQERYEQGTEVGLTAEAAERWYFVEWTGDVVGEEGEAITMIMDEDKDITAHFEELEYYELTVKIEGEGTVDVDPDQDEYEEGTEVGLTAEAAEEWYFVEWTGDVPVEGEAITMIMDEDKEITAHFEEYVTLRIEDITGNGSVMVDGDVVETPFERDYEQGEEVDILAEPAEDWYFEGWDGLLAENASMTITMNEDLTINEALFERYVTLTITEIMGEGTVIVDGDVVETPFERNYEQGEEAEILAEPAEDWYFEGWGGIDEEDTSITITMSENVTITEVLFEEDEGSISMWMLIGMVLVVVVVLAIVIGFMMVSDDDDDDIYMEPEGQQQIQAGYAQTQQVQQVQSPPPPPPPPPPEPQADLCPDCGQPIRFVEEHYCWYCDGCQEYK